jgi:hypothetical protein
LPRRGHRSSACPESELEPVRHHQRFGAAVGAAHPTKSSRGLWPKDTIESRSRAGGRLHQNSDAETRGPGPPSSSDIGRADLFDPNLDPNATGQHITSMKARGGTLDRVVFPDETRRGATAQHWRRRLPKRRSQVRVLSGPPNFPLKTQRGDSHRDSRFHNRLLSVGSSPGDLRCAKSLFSLLLSFQCWRPRRCPLLRNHRTTILGAVVSWGLVAARPLATSRAISSA